MRRSRGFTLIEVMIVVAIITILAAIAVPAYGEYVTRSRITEALSTLSAQRVKMEQYYQDNRRYDNACDAGQIAAMSNGKYFNFSCGAPAGNNYTITATGTGTMANFVYTLNQANAQGTTTVGQNWTGAGSTCWVLKKDGSC